MTAIVAIGRNEGPRLERCLQAAVGCPGVAVVYVDSGSTDDSLTIAHRLGVMVVELDLSTPFTAARARNAGFQRALAAVPDLRFVQFIDGDCELQPDWIETARVFLESNPRAAVVCGRRRERFPGASIYNRLCDLEWDTPIGPAKSCGGDAMFRRDALEHVGGYNPQIIAGEEPELCVRLRAAGWEVHRLDAEMTLHDAAMTRFSQWWKRNIRAGHAYAEGYHRHGAPPERFALKQVRSNWFWGLIVPGTGLGLALLLVWVAPWFAAIAVLLTLAGYLGLVWRVYRHRRRRGTATRQALLYALFTVLGKFPQMLGQLKFHRDRIRGRRAKLIEYKGF